MNRHLSIFVVFTTLIAHALICIDAGLACQSEQTESTKANSFWAARRHLEKRLASELTPLIDQQRRNGHQTKNIEQFLIPRDPNRFYLFYPPESKLGADRFPDLKDEPKTKLVAALESHANKLFELAKQEASAGNPAWAIQLFNEVLYFLPDHEETRRLLGHRTTHDDQKNWRVKPDRLQIRRGRNAQKRFKWPAKNYWVASTENFHITSNASEQETIELAQSLERWKDAWRQVFFEYYNTGKNLNRWIAGTSKPPKSRRKHKVFFFANRNAYVAQLEPSIPGIGNSTGYYSDVNRESYFFADDDKNIRDTWRHEMTHQLFQESRNTQVGSFNDGFLWLGEGIAMYMESLVDHGAYVTIGGFDSRRLQYARMRRLKEQFRVPIEELSAMTLQEFQSVPEIAKVYSQSAGVTHYLMNANDADHQRQLIEFLKLTYEGKLKRSTFENTLDISYPNIESGYNEFLKVRLDELPFFDAAAKHRELALVGVRLEEESLNMMGAGSEMDWLDLSACDVRGQRLKQLKSSNTIGSLFLTGSVLDTETVQILSELPVLELDLSGTTLDDEQLQILSKSKTIRLIGINGSKVSAAGVRNFSAARPDITLSKSFN